MIYICILLLFSVLLESSLTTLPLVLLTILIGAVILKRNELIGLAFGAGLILDMLTLKPLGFSSLALVLFVFIIYLYRRKFEIENLIFVLVFSFLGSLIYLLISGTGLAVFESILAMLMAGISFYIFQITNRKSLKYSKYG